MTEQVLLAVIGAFGVVGRILWVRARTRLTEAEERRKTAEAQAEVAISAAKAQAQRITTEAEGRIREVADQHGLMKAMLDEMSDANKRSDDKDTKNRAVLFELLDASRESTETLKHHNQRLTRIEDGTKRIQTDIGEGVRLLTTLERTVSELPGHVDQSVNPIVDSVASVVRRIDVFIDGLEGAKTQLLQDLITAIRTIRVEAVREAAIESLPAQTNPMKDEPAHETL